VLDPRIEANKTVNKARRLVDGPEDLWGSSTPLALARTAARRCGQLVSVCERSVATALLAELP
jgi:hypothetical protein